jgi:transcriptional regulator with XRE-family HTH domain
LKLELVKRGETNNALAAAVGCTPGTISQIIRGRLTPSADLKRRIAEHLGRPVDELFVEVDYAAEYRRLRIRHGLNPDEIQYVRDAIAARMPPSDPAA